jgi:hypothetical protein
MIKRNRWKLKKRLKIFEEHEAYKKRKGNNNHGRI